MPPTVELLLALQRSAGNSAIARMIEAHSRPSEPTLQRIVDTSEAAKENKDFAQAAPVVLEAIARTNSDLWALVNDPTQNVDLVFRTGLGLTGGTGETKPLVGDPKQGRRLEDALRDNQDLKNERITIEIWIDRSGWFWMNSPGFAAETIAHEYAVHAERYAKMIREIRARGNTGGEGRRRLVQWSREDEFDPDVHHRSIYEDDAHHARFETLVKRIAIGFLELDQQKQAQNLLHQYYEDVKEHVLQAKGRPWTREGDSPILDRPRITISDLRNEMAEEKKGKATATGKDEDEKKPKAEEVQEAAKGLEEVFSLGKT